MLYVYCNCIYTLIFRERIQCFTEYVQVTYIAFYCKVKCEFRIPIGHQSLIVCLTVHISQHKHRIICGTITKLRCDNHFTVFARCHVEIRGLIMILITIDTHTDLVTIQTVAKNIDFLLCTYVTNRCRNSCFAASYSRYFTRSIYGCNCFVGTAPYRQIPFFVVCYKRRFFIHGNKVACHIYA